MSTATTPANSSSLRTVASLVGWEVLPIIGTYYVLRAFGVSEYLSLLIGTAAGAVRVAWVALASRRFDGFAAFTCAVFGTGMVLSFLTGDPRSVLAVKSLTTVTIGVIFAVTCFAGRPLLYSFAKRFGAGHDPEIVARWDARYAADPRVRRGYRFPTAVWAVAMFIEAAVRVVMVYTLPVDLTVSLSTVLLVGTIAGVMLWSLRYIKTRVAPLMAAAPGYADHPERH